MFARSLRRAAVKLKASILAVCVWLLLGALLAGAPSAEARVIKRSSEISIGRETASMIERHFIVDADPVAVARVRQIGRRLVATADDPDFPFEFHVIESPEVNAFAIPGGFVYVFRGLLQLVPNDDALAFVLGHEIAHVTRSHSIKQFEKNVLLSAGLTAVLAGVGGSRGVFGDAARVAHAVTTLSFSRSDENDADTHGIRNMVRAGYNPAAAVEAMELIRRAAGGDGGGPALLRTHPAPSSRIRRLEHLASDLKPERPVGPAPFIGEAPSLPEHSALAGLDDVDVHVCDWAPMEPGARWVYRVRQGAGSGSLVVRALEHLAATPRGVVRVEFDLGHDVKTTRLLVPAGDRYFSGEDLPREERTWRLEAIFPKPPPPGEAVVAEAADSESPKPGAGRRTEDEGLRCVGSETVSVPAGEFSALRIERRDPDGTLLAISWYAAGAGLVRREVPATGLVQELVSYNIPR
jgi:Zn-dependent protease with chaperone function